ncbi:MAG TPA: BamA/TamA family outer membrane protein, partial [Puia sp.]|nr:BamA/TamA family outer membrane protein [Puia sp.]
MVLVCMDSQWWLEEENERTGLASDCPFKNPKAVINALKDIVSSYPDKLIVLAMHHAFYTHGEHGGYFTLRQHIFPLTDLQPWLYVPLPVIGSIYPIARSVFGNVQDTRNPGYKDLIEGVEDVIRESHNVVHVAGHEHTLQLLEHDSTFYVVSGAGSKHTPVKKGQYSLFAHEGVGFAVIEVTADGKSVVKFFGMRAGSEAVSRELRAVRDRPDGEMERDSAWLLYTAQLPSVPKHESVTEAVAKFPDSMTVVAYKGFAEAGGMKRFWLGANYRKEWATPIRVPVFDMTGWKPLQRGGGTQTRSLRLENADGTEYVLRGVQKYIKDEAIPQALQGTAFVKDLVTDGVSASYPYAALSIPPLAQALRIPHASPRLVYVPDDPRLGRFRTDFADLFCMIEEREPGNGKKTYNTDDMEKKIKEDNDNTIDQRAVLRARSLDMFVMDFDRHEDQWRWMSADNGKGRTFAPVPRDRDQPFFINEGVLPWVAGSAFVAPQLQGFRVKARNFLTFNFNARNFDHNYMTELTEQDWRNAAKTVLGVMTDSMIESALKLQPGPVQGYSMQRIIDKLKARRKYYEGELMSYYKFLAKTVSVYGSDKKELFDVTRGEDGTVTVVEYKISKDGDTSKKMYERKFFATETHEIRLYGQGGDDVFRVHGNGGGGIVVRMIGGPGSDRFDNTSEAGAGKSKVYDLSTEKNTFSGDGNYRSYLSSDPSVNAINKRGFKYNVLTPFINVGYNPDDGVFLGAQFWYTTQGFHKDPYKQLHYFSFLHALSTKAYIFKYSFEAIDAIGKVDLLAHAVAQAPENTINFFGLGNGSIYDKSQKEGIRYYRARFNQYDGDLQLRKRFGPVFQLSAGPAFEYVSLDSTDNQGRFINRTDLNGLDRATLYRTKTYLGGKATAVLDGRNNKVNPSRGIYWETNFGSYGGLNDVSHRFSQLNSDLSLFLSFNSRANVVIATRVGYGKTFGDFEFYQAQFLGATENLRGYRKFRFAGDESFFHNIDLRIKLAEFRTYLFPGAFGVQLFNDVGRVWLKGQKDEA